jgi:hypothetical protein
MNKSTKVKIEVTLHVDVDAWLENFPPEIWRTATRDRANEVRIDAKNYFAQICQEQLERIGCEVKA